MNLKPNLALLGDYTAKRAIKQFAEKYHLVYFGKVDQRGDDYELVRGLTASTHHQDAHYTVGTIEGHDVAFVERFNRLTFPGKPVVDLVWQILQVDLERGGLPHIFINFRQHEETVYSDLFARLPHFKDLTDIFKDSDAAFAKHARVFGPPQHYGEIGDLLPPAVTGTLTHYFRQFDFEIHGDRLYIYAPKTRLTVQLLGDMARVGVWLASQLQQEPSATS